MTVVQDLEMSLEVVLEMTLPAQEMSDHLNDFIDQN